MPPPAEILARARAYPFPRPDTSVVVAGSRVLELLELDPVDIGASRVRFAGAAGSLADACADGRVPADALAGRRSPVLAYGSNASPASLGWKFPAERHAVVPLVRGALGDLDVVYSAHIAVYGSIPATLQRSAGTEPQAFVAFLTETQLELVASWEINARYELLHGAVASVETGERPAAAGAFVSRHGCLTREGAEIAVAEVPARRRRYAPMTQPEALEHVRARVAAGVTPDDFILENVRDYDRARAYTAELRRTARPFERSRRGDSNP